MSTQRPNFAAVSCALLLAVSLATLQAVAGGETRVHAIARVVDGDTLEMGDDRLRLIGIDAPEATQTCQADGRDWLCGAAAGAALADLVEGARVRCEILGRDRYGRGLAVCYANGLELNREMVRQGWALAWYPARGAVEGPAYDEEQAAARGAERGLWRGRFMKPWEWRQR